MTIMTPEEIAAANERLRGLREGEAAARGGVAPEPAAAAPRGRLGRATDSIKGWAEQAGKNKYVSKAGKLLGVADIVLNTGKAIDNARDGDYYGAVGHGLAAGMNFIPIARGGKALAQMADIGTGGGTGELIGAGLRKAGEFVGLSEPRAAQGGGDMPAASPTPAVTQPVTQPTNAQPVGQPGFRRMSEGEATGVRDNINSGKLTSGDVAPGTGYITKTGADGKVTGQQLDTRGGGGGGGGAPQAAMPDMGGGAQRRELPALPKFDFSSPMNTRLSPGGPSGDRSGFGQWQKIIEQQPMAAQYVRDAKNQRFGFEQDKHADNVALVKSAQQIEANKAAAANELAKAGREAALRKESLAERKENRDHTIGMMEKTSIGPDGKPDAQQAGLRLGIMQNIAGARGADIGDLTDAERTRAAGLANIAGAQNREGTDFGSSIAQLVGLEGRHRGVTTHERDLKPTGFRKNWYGGEYATTPNGDVNLSDLNAEGRTMMDEWRKMAK